MFAVAIRFACNEKFCIYFINQALYGGTIFLGDANLQMYSAVGMVAHVLAIK